MNNMNISQPAISSLIAGVIAFAIYEIIAKIVGIGFRSGLPAAAIVGVITFVVALVINLVIRSLVARGRK
jgi:uncharacterized membrane protein (UPF0136 family)